MINKGLAVAVILVVVSLTGFRATAQTVDNLKDQQAQLQQKLKQLNQQINGFQNQISQTQKKTSSLKNELSIYDNQISSLQLQIEANRTQMLDANLQIKELQDQIAARQLEIQNNKIILNQLIVQLNELDSNSIFNLGLGTDNFSAFLDQVQYTESVQTKVYQVLQNIKAIKAKLEAQEADLQIQLTKLQELQDQLNQTQDILGSQRQQKQKLLDQTRGLEKNFQKLLTTSKGEANKLQQEMDDLDNAIRAKLGQRTLKARGALAYPMDGIMTQGYGNTGFTALGYNFHNGIDLAVPAGTPIYAAADGVVAACDTGEASYGNWCAIKHTLSGGRQIVTLYGHMRSYKLSVGQKVKQGDLVGYEGNTGNTTRLLYGQERGYHLHFSVFDAEGFGVSPGKYTSIYGHYTVPFGYTYNPLDFLSK